MNNYASSPFEEIVVRIIPARQTAEQPFDEPDSSSPETVKRSYDALIYTHLDFPGVPVSSPPPGQRDRIAGLPFVGVERIIVRWRSYQRYLADFVEGEKAFHQMRTRLLEALPPALNLFFANPPPSVKPIRLWLNGETPELDDLPWELIAPARNDNDSERFFLVRGLPPETISPIVQIKNQLRVALIHQPQFTPNCLTDAFNQLSPNVEVTSMTESPFSALERAAREGFEIIHIVADGTVSLAYDGILYFHGLRAEDSSQSSYQSSDYSQSASPQITPSELSMLLRNCRVSVLCLTEQDYSNPDSVEIAGREVPSVYRAFAYLGGSRLPLPSIVAPLGVLKSEQGRNFWTEFYRHLSVTFNLPEAVTKARTRDNISLPIALFLRHFQNVLFRRESAQSPQPEVDPVHLGASLQLSSELVTNLKENFSDSYGELSDSIGRFVESEEKRQATLTAELEPWLKAEEEIR